MKQPKSITIRVRELETDATAAGSAIARNTLRQALGTKKSALVAQTAELAAKLELHELDADLCAAFEYFIDEGAASDKRCVAKRAIVKALAELKLNQHDLFLQGMRFYWPERPWPGRSDDASGLRILCVETLGQFGHPDLLFDLLDPLSDPTPDVRIAALRAFGSTGERAAALLLRYMARSGDAEAPVIDACFSALIALQGVEAIPFVAEFLSTGSERVRTAAALALGESEHESALDLLVQCRQRQYDEDFRMDLLVAIAMLRRPRALDYLISLIASGGSDAENALQALAIHRSNPSLVARIKAAVETLDEPAVTSLLATKFRE
jgi:hypothetical protein